MVEEIAPRWVHFFNSEFRIHNSEWWREQRGCAVPLKENGCGRVRSLRNLNRRTARLEHFALLVSVRKRTRTADGIPVPRTARVRTPPHFRLWRMTHRVTTRIVLHAAVNGFGRDDNCGFPFGLTNCSKAPEKILRRAHFIRLLMMTQGGGVGFP